MRARLFAVGSDDSFRVYFESWGDHDALCWVGSLSNEVQGPKGHTGNRRAIPTSCPERNPVPGLEVRRVGPCWSGVRALLVWGSRPQAAVCKHSFPLHR